MSQENVDLVRSGYEAFNRRDFDAALALMDEAVTWKPFFALETTEHRGKDEIRAAWESQTDLLDIHIEVLELTALDETHVLAVGKWVARGSGSGAVVEHTNAQVFTVENSKLHRVETFTSRKAALEAAGLSE